MTRILIKNLILTLIINITGFAIAIPTEAEDTKLDSIPTPSTLGGGG